MIEALLPEHEKRAVSFMEEVLKLATIHTLTSISATNATSASIEVMTDLESSLRSEGEANIAEGFRKIGNSLDIQSAQQTDILVMIMGFNREIIDPPLRDIANLAHDRQGSLLYQIVVQNESKDIHGISIPSSCGVTLLYKFE